MNAVVFKQDEQDVKDHFYQENLKVNEELII